MIGKQCVGSNYQPSDLQLGELQKNRIEVAFADCLQNM